jgi:tRNA(Met) C34 N-acetyltransferase TmcA
LQKELVKLVKVPLENKQIPKNSQVFVPKKIKIKIKIKIKNIYIFRKTRNTNHMGVNYFCKTKVSHFWQKEFFFLHIKNNSQCSSQFLSECKTIIIRKLGRI